MPELTDAPGCPAVVAHHGITVVVTPRETDAPFSWPWRASCLCGWLSQAVPTRPHAAADGEKHLAANKPDPITHSNPKEHLTMHGQPQNFTALPPCPWWCTSASEGHACEYDSVGVDDPLTQYRNHAHSFGGSVAVVQSEANRLGSVTLEPVRVSVYVETADSVSDAKALADGLRAASELMARIERTDQALTITSEAGTVVVPPCPPWCVLPADHDLNDPNMREFNGSVTRLHIAGEWTTASTYPADQIRVTVSRTEQVGSCDESPKDPASVLICTDVATLDAAQARQAAASLTAAADTLAAIEGSHSGATR